MDGLRTTAAVVALVGAGAWGSVMLRAQNEEGANLRDVIAAQQQQALEAAGAAEADGAEVTEDLFSEDELDELVAPVALYPDALLAQVLVAAAFPLQVAKADQLIDASADMTDEELSDELASREFDPSVLVLMSGFPTVISRMADDLDWTDRLGQAMIAQDDDVLAAVQRMRAEAEAQGNLTSNAAQVIEKDDDQIYIKPADPKVVYVPTYDPQSVYTTAYTPSTATTPYVAPQSGSNPLANPFIAGALAFGGGLLVSELFDDDNDGSNKNKNNGGWDDYWQSGRPIDWHDRQFYPRPAYAGAGSTSWSRERDRDWDRRTARWRREDAESISAYQQGRQDTLEEIQRHSEKRAERMREAARDERATAEAQRERIRDQRQEAAKAADEQRNDEAATVKARREKAAEQNKERAKREAQREKQAEEERAAAAKTREEARAKRKAAEEDQAKQAAKKADDQNADDNRKAAEKAAEEDQAKAAAAQKAQEQKQAEKRKAARQEARKCRQNPDDKGCESGN